MSKKLLHQYFESSALSRPKWLKRHRMYYNSLEKYYSFLIPQNQRVIEIGCGMGDLLAALKPAYGVGVDWSKTALELARERHPELYFIEQDAEELQIDEQFDYVVLSGLLGSLWDIQTVIERLQPLCHSRTRIIVSITGYHWEPIFKFADYLGLKEGAPLQNWLTMEDVVKFADLSGFEPVRVEQKLLFPKYIPVFSWIMNRFLANLPLFRKATLVNFLVLRKQETASVDRSVSIVVPARNERGNVEKAITRTPKFGTEQEFIFIEGNSADNTYEEMLRVQEQYPEIKIKVAKQTGVGKGDAVRLGFEMASNDILFILDADLTTPPEDMPKFYQAIVQNKGEFINGCRLVYPMEKQAMRWLNLIANRFFGVTFSYLLGQTLKDTLCGTKVLYKSDYETIRANRDYFGDFDPFGDFDLLFGAAKLNLKITEVNVRYKDREYGTTQISRFKHGLLLLRMTLFASRKLKFF